MHVSPVCCIVPCVQGLEPLSRAVAAAGAVAVGLRVLRSVGKRVGAMLMRNRR